MSIDNGESPPPSPLRDANAAMFEYRPSRFHTVSPRAARVIAAVPLIFALGAVLALTLLLLAPKLPGEGALAAMQSSFGALTLVPLLAAVIFQAIDAWQLLARRQLVITDTHVHHRCSLAFGIGPQGEGNWSLALADIAEIRSPAPLTLHPLQVPTELRLELRMRNGSARSIEAPSWFVPGSPPRQSLRPPRRPGIHFTLSEAHIWSTPENQHHLREFFSRLPVVEAFAKRGKFASPPSIRTIPPQMDLFAWGKVKFGLLAGLGLIVASLLLMLALPDEHTEEFLSPWQCAGLGFVLALAYLGYLSTGADRPPWSHRWVAAVLLFFGIATAIHPLTVTLNCLVTAESHSVEYVVQNGALVPSSTGQEFPVIDLPGRQIRSAWLREGTAVKREIRKGLFGLWHYSDPRNGG